jgi:hypothetical protein
MSSKTKSTARHHDNGKTPSPNSKSGKRFDELYRLKGVVSFADVVGE